MRFFFQGPVLSLVIHTSRHLTATRVTQWIWSSAPIFCPNTVTCQMEQTEVSLSPLETGEIRFQRQCHLTDCHLMEIFVQKANHFYTNSDDTAKLFCCIKRGVKGDRCAFKFALMQSFLIFFNFAHPYSFPAFCYLSCVFLQLETVIFIFQCCLWNFRESWSFKSSLPCRCRQGFITRSWVRNTWRNPDNVCVRGQLKWRDLAP